MSRASDRAWKGLLAGVLPTCIAAAFTLGAEDELTTACTIGTLAVHEQAVEAIRFQQTPPPPKQVAKSFAVDVIIAHWLETGELEEQNPKALVASFRSAVRRNRASNQVDEFERRLMDAKRRLRVECGGS